MAMPEFLNRWTRKAADANGRPPRPAPETPGEIVREALRTVLDPEVGVNIVDLGLVYAVEATEERVRTDITLTTPTCPLGETVAEDARAAIRQALPGVRDLSVRLVWEPAWTPAMMSDDARRQLGW
ncbi:metal-sulfur cluster assembly factor [Azospirillum thermophilum]|nr:metal-sulfur cluster assembly factor [Azospirillum thermophilum]